MLNHKCRSKLKKEFMEYLSTIFNIDLGGYYDAYIAMKERKTKLHISKNWKNVLPNEWTKNKIAIAFMKIALDIVLLCNDSRGLPILQALQGVAALHQVLLGIQKQPTAEYPYFSYWLSSNHFP